MTVLCHPPRAAGRFNFYKTLSVVFDGPTFPPANGPRVADLAPELSRTRGPAGAVAGKITGAGFRDSSPPV